MKVTTSYQCETCLAKFDTEKKAIKCEKGHAKTLNITKEQYNYHNKYPDYISVIMEDGKEITYQILNSYQKRCSV